MYERWKELYYDTLFTFPNTKYYSSTVFRDRFIKRKDNFLSFFNKIKEDYSDNRHYHTLEHVNNVLNSLNLFTELDAEDRLLLKYVAWFHDIVYDPTKTNNENESGIVFVNFALEFGFLFDFAKEGHKLILLTDHKSDINSHLGKIICDCDLVGFSFSNFLERSELVRKEYSHINDEQWKKGRLLFLKSMLDKEHIFKTVRFRKLYETEARNNINEEIVYLNSK